MVDTTADTADGNTTSIAALLGNKGADGRISLREALLAANNTTNLGTPDLIQFNIPGAGPHTINVTSDLPTITEAVIIDGWSEPDYAGTPVIELNGNAAGAGVDGLRVTAGGSTIRGLVLNRFSGDGIELNGGSGNIIQGNYLGTNVAGTADRGNGLDGIRINNSADNLIGGLTSAERNVISGNNTHGVRIIGESADNNITQGNYIGLNAAGAAAIGNTYNGIIIYNGADNNLVGGTALGAGNVVSGNLDTGVEIQDGNSTGNRIEGNLIGLNAAGTAAIGNLDGVIIEDAPNNTVGGATAAHRNTISGNTGAGQGSGVVIFGANATGNLIQNNYIGTDITGLLDLGNEEDGVLISDRGDGGVNKGGASANTIRDNVLSGNDYSGVSLTQAGVDNNLILGNYIGVDATGFGALGNAVFGVVIWDGADGNQIGDVAPGAGNVIAFNGRGVLVDANTTTSINNSIRGNSIYSNSGLGIDLNNDGVTLNDLSDGDLGPNGLQNYPVLTSAAVFGADLTVTGTLKTLAGLNCDLDFYWNPAGDPSGHGEGRTYIGSTNVTSDVSGNASFSKTFVGVAVPVGAVITATATDAAGNTSEFSLNRAAVNGNTAPVLNPLANPVLAENTTLVTTVTATDADLPAQTLTFSISGGARRGPVHDRQCDGRVEFPRGPELRSSDGRRGGQRLRRNRPGQRWRGRHGYPSDHGHRHGRQRQ